MEVVLKAKLGDSITTFYTLDDVLHMLSDNNANYKIINSYGSNLAICVNNELIGFVWNREEFARLEAVGEYNLPSGSNLFFGSLTKFV